MNKTNHNKKFSIVSALIGMGIGAILGLLAYNGQWL